MPIQEILQLIQDLTQVMTPEVVTQDHQVVAMVLVVAITLVVAMALVVAMIIANGKIKIETIHQNLPT